jgi:hypothetical protein
VPPHRRDVKVIGLLLVAALLHWGSSVRKRIFIAGIGLIILGTFLSACPLHLLILEKNDNWAVIKVVQPGDTFSLVYLHSVSLNDVREIFRIDREYRIILTETKFQGQGAGLPSAALPYERWLYEGNWFHIIGMKRIVPSPFFWRVDSQWKSRFQFGGENEQYISWQVGDGLIKIQIQKSNLLEWLLHRLKNHLERII